MVYIGNKNIPTFFVNCLAFFSHFLNLLQGFVDILIDFFSLSLWTVKKGKKTKGIIGWPTEFWMFYVHLCFFLPKLDLWFCFCFKNLFKAMYIVILYWYNHVKEPYCRSEYITAIMSVTSWFYCMCIFHFDCRTEVIQIHGSFSWCLFSFDQHSGKDYFNKKKDAETA